MSLDFVKTHPEQIMPVSKQFGTQMKTFGTDAESEYVRYMSAVLGRVRVM